MSEKSVGQGNEASHREESVKIDMKGHDPEEEEEGKTASNPDINRDLNTNVNTDKNPDLNKSKTRETCTNNENSVEHVEIEIDGGHKVPSPSLNAKFLCSDPDSKAEIFIDRPLCAGYRSVDSEVDPDSDSDSDTDLDLDYDSDLFNSESDSSSPDEATAIPNKGGKCEKKKKEPDTTDLSLCDLPPIENLKISVPEEECEEIGVISGIVGTLVVVEAYKNTPAYDIDSVLFLDKGRKTLGKIFDVFGPVCEPVYSVRFNNAEEIKRNRIVKGLKVYSAPRTEHTSLVSVSELMKMKGSDASWKNNEEAPPEFQDFSDDEAEERFRNRENAAATKPERRPMPMDLRRKKARFYRPKTNHQSASQLINVRPEFPANNTYWMNSSRQPPPPPPPPPPPSAPAPPANVNNNCGNWGPYPPPPPPPRPHFPPVPQNNPVQVPFQYFPRAYYGQGYYCQGYQRYQLPNYFPRFPPTFPNMPYMYPPTNPFLLPPPGPPPPVVSENNPPPVKEFAREPSRQNV